MTFKRNCLKSIFLKLTALLLAIAVLFSLPITVSASSSIEVSADAAMLVNMNCGKVLFSKNENKIMYPASITKLMTAIVAAENISDLEGTFITYSSTANRQLKNTGAAVYGLKIGERMKARDALAALLVSSYGDTAYAIAEYVGETVDGFVKMMNDKAEELGLDNTHFTNPVGLHSKDNYSTAQDIYTLASYAFSIDIIKELSSKASYTISSTNYHTSKEIHTSNILLNKNSDFYYENAICGKTGFTNQAGHCLVSMASENGTTYMAIILKANTYGGFKQKFKDSINMYKWAFENFEYRTIFSTQSTIDKFKVNHAQNCDYVELYPNKELKALLPKNADPSGITIKHSNEQKEINAPLNAGEIIAVADVYYGNEKLGSVDLIAKNDVKLNNFTGFITASKNAVTDFLTSPIMIALYIILCMVILCLIILIVHLNAEKFKGVIKKPVNFIKIHIINEAKTKIIPFIKNKISYVIKK